MSRELPQNCLGTKHYANRKTDCLASIVMFFVKVAFTPSGI